MVTRKEVLRWKVHFSFFSASWMCFSGRRLHVKILLGLRQKLLDWKFVQRTHRLQTQPSVNARTVECVTAWQSSNLISFHECFMANDTRLFRAPISFQNDHRSCSEEFLSTLTKGVLPPPLPLSPCILAPSVSCLGRSARGCRHLCPSCNHARTTAHGAATRWGMDLLPSPLPGTQENGACLLRDETQQRRCVARSSWYWSGCSVAWHCPTFPALADGRGITPQLWTLRMARTADAQDRHEPLPFITGDTWR